MWKFVVFLLVAVLCVSAEDEKPTEKGILTEDRTALMKYQNYFCNNI